ncbi:hypothetical protein DKX38_009474 [Salix brachista]|uniref:Uncharacterized protein n=1 Tax=Salix brachista TaxID=2182728 RepID=A0A5N5MD06_9ROSI|nr:hypothetical protein DKX38_009474 [Salix brachista]
MLLKLQELEDLEKLFKSSGNTTNAVGRPLPARHWEQIYSPSNYRGYNSTLNYNSRYDSGTYGSSYGGVGGLHGGGMSGNNMYRGGYGGLYGSGMYGGGAYNSGFGGAMGGYGMGMGGPFARSGELFWPLINSQRPEYTGFSHVHDCASYDSFSIALACCMESWLDVYGGCWESEQSPGWSTHKVPIDFLFQELKVQMRTLATLKGRRLLQVVLGTMIGKMMLANEEILDSISYGVNLLFFLDRKDISSVILS